MPGTRQKGVPAVDDNQAHEIQAKALELGATLDRERVARREQIAHIQTTLADIIAELEDWKRAA